MTQSSVWAEIDLDAIAHNVRSLRKRANANAKFMAVVKADGYGHGAAAVAQTALENGADTLGVARLEEAVTLRQAGFGVPILVFGYTPPADTQKLLDHDLQQSVYAIETAQAYSQAAATSGRQLTVHIKVDTGMGRLGVLTGEMMPSATGKAVFGKSVRLVKDIVSLPGLQLGGLLTHFASSDSRDKADAREQLKRFQNFCERLRIAGIEVPLMHAANSGALIDMPETHLDMVRPGISLYGLYPSTEVDRSVVELRPAMTLKTKIVHLKQVPPGFKVSYGGTWQSTAPTTIATVSVGYADGYRRALSNRADMLVAGQRAPVVGRVCMDLTMLDVGHIPNLAIGQEVVVFGRQGQAVLPAEELAAQLETIPYEIVTALTTRVPKRIVESDNDAV